MTAQICSIQLKGLLNDSHDATPVSDASIYLSEVETEQWTDAKGKFSFANLCPGTYHLIIQHIGCPTKRIAFELYADTIMEINIEHHLNMLHEVDVHEHHDNAMNEHLLGINSIDNNSQKSLAASLSQVPGVNMISNGSDIGVPMIHGLTGNRMTVINNGVLHSGQQWGTDHSPEIDLNSAGNVTVVNGAAAIRYPGTHMGGIVVLSPLDIPYDPHLHGKARSTIESNGRGGTLNAQLFKGLKSIQWRIGTTLKHYGDRHSPEYYLKNTGTKQAHANAELRKQWKNKLEWEGYYNFFSANYGILRGSHIGNLTDLESAFERQIPFYTDSFFSNALQAPKQWVQHHQIKSTLRKQWNSKMLEWNFSGQRNQRREFDVRRSGRSDIPALSLLHHSLQSDLIVTNNKSFEIGYQLLGKNNTNIPETGILPLIPNYVAFTNGMYASYSRRFSIIKLDIGGRYDFTFRNIAMLTNSIPREIAYFTNKFHHIGFIGRGTINVSPKWKMLGELSLKQRPPEINELYAFGLHQGVSGIEEGNADLNRERGIKSTLQLRGLIGEKIHVDLRGYMHLFNGYIFLQPQSEFRLTIRGAFPVYTYEQCDARLTGGDFILKYKLGEDWNFETTWSYVHGTNRSNQLPLTFMPPLQGQHKFSYEIPEWNSWRNLKIELEHEYVAQQWHWDPTLDFIAPPKSYNLFNLQMSTTLNKWKFKPQLRVGVKNISNTIYRDYLNRQRYFANALGRNVTLSWIQNF